MKEAQRIAEKVIGHPRYRFKIPSHSHPDIVYDVEIMQNGEVRCSCPVSLYRQKDVCKHGEEALRKLTPFQRALIYKKKLIENGGNSLL